MIRSAMFVFNPASVPTASKEHIQFSLRILVLMVLLFMACVTHPQPAAASDANTRIVLLGTAGGPSAKPARAQPANAIIVNDDIYIVDTGDGVVRQLALGGYPLSRVRGVFVTHLHSDHVTGYGPLLLRAWLSGRDDTIRTFGPPGLVEMTQDYLRHMRRDIELRVTSEGRQPLADMLDANDIASMGMIYEDENLKVTVFPVDHGEAKPAYGFRFDTHDMSVVFSGDTSPNKNVIDAAKGADVLVHEVISVPAIDAMIAAASPGNTEMRDHLLGDHSTPEQVGEVATAAGVRTLVLTHFGGTGHPEFDRPEVWEAAVRKTWSGALIIGEDLLVIE